MKIICHLGIVMWAGVKPCNLVGEGDEAKGRDETKGEKRIKSGA